MANANKNNHSELPLLFVIFGVTITLYLLLGGRYGSGDTVPTSLAALNLLQHGTVYFDNFRDSYLAQGQAYYFTESLGGHWISIYPIGASILTFPIYLVLYLGLQLWGPHLDITDPAFEPLRLLCQSIAAAIVTALTVVVFYRASRLKFPRRVALLSTITFAFATSTWSTSARALWQHGPANLLLVTGFYLLLRSARRPTPGPLLMHLFLAGLCFGFLPSVRPTSALFTIAALAYVIYYYRLRALGFMAGFVAYLPALGWNVYHFGQLSGGYGNMFGQAPYVLTLSHFLTTALAHLVSPSRGLLVISPVLLLSIAGLVGLSRSPTEPPADRWLIYALLLAALGMFIQYSFYTVWWAGWSPGTRFMTDLLVPLVYLLNYALAELSQARGWRKLTSLAFPTLLGFSLLVQVALVMGATGWQWDPLPIDINLYPQRVWHLRDSQVIRCLKSLAIPLRVGQTRSPAYLAQLGGTIDQVTVLPYAAEVDPFKDFPDDLPNPDLHPGDMIYVRAQLTNGGNQPWFGVHSALIGGETRIRTQIMAEGQGQSEDRLFVLADRVPPGQKAVAIGMVKLPDTAGRYKLKLDLLVNEIGKFPTSDVATSQVNLVVRNAAH
jgi:hypothetical protein